MNEIMMKEELKRINAKNSRSAWNRGVNEYSEIMLDDIIDSMEWCNETFDEMNVKLLLNRALNGASDWAQYSWGGCSLIYNEDIAKRLCNPSELKITDNGRKAPNKNEEWLDTQARALYQAFERIKTAFNNLKEMEYNNVKNQSIINANAKIIYNKIFKNCNNFVWKQFNQKNCYVSQCILNRYFLVKSYNTIVAIIDGQNGDLYELNKYSRTTSKQITQFFNLPDVISCKKYGFSKLENRYLCTNSLTTW